MQEYEIRLINQAGVTALISTNRYFSDAAALHAARLMCKDSESAEVWRGDVCVTTSTPRPQPRLVWPVPPAEILR